MSRIKKNIAANFGGSLWTALVSLLFIPIYLNFLGVEAYGLVAIFATLLAMFAVLDMGLIQTITREIARLTVLPDSAREMRDLLRTLEIPYVGMGLMIGLVVVFIAPWIAHEWVNNQTLPTQSVETAVILMGLMVAIQWPLGFYSGGLVGLQELGLRTGVMLTETPLIFTIVLVITAAWFLVFVVLGWMLRDLGVLGAVIAYGISAVILAIMAYVVAESRGFTK